MSSADAGGVWGTLWDNLDRLVMKMLAKMIKRELCYLVSHENMENATFVFFIYTHFFLKTKMVRCQIGEEKRQDAS